MLPPSSNISSFTLSYTFGNGNAFSGDCPKFILGQSLKLSQEKKLNTQFCT